MSEDSDFVVDRSYDKTWVKKNSGNNVEFLN